jgi:hypothetical protein
MMILLRNGIRIPLFLCAHMKRGLRKLPLPEKMPNSFVFLTRMDPHPPLKQHLEAHEHISIGRRTVLHSVMVNQ